MPKNILNKPDDDVIALLRAWGSNDEATYRYAGQALAQITNLPLREGVFDGDIVSDLFYSFAQTSPQPVEYPLDLIQPGTEAEYVAMTIPKEGYIPQRQAEGDYVVIPTYAVGGSMQLGLDYVRDANWDVVSRAMEALMVQFIKKRNDDGWHTILAAAVDRNILVYDGNAQAGQFTKRLVSLMKLVMRRNGGGNSSSVNRSVLTDLYLSPEAMEDIRNWNVDQVDDVTRREIFVADEILSRIFGVNLNSLDEFGVGQEYQDYYTTTLGGSLPGAATNPDLTTPDQEIVIGVNKQRREKSFVNPVREEVSVYDDPVLHRQRLVGWYAWANWGFGVLDNRDIILGSI